MNTTTLPASTHMGSVALDVADLDAMTPSTATSCCWTRSPSAGTTVDLGRGSDVLVTLRHRPACRAESAAPPGLFHTAILHDGPTALATTLASFALARPELYTGSGDHLVSQAFYLDDPEGNGVELYYDRPRDSGRGTTARSAWTPSTSTRTSSSASTSPLPPATSSRPPPGRRGSLPDQTIVGHVHLKVGDTARAKDFYVDTLGFDVTAELPGALFVSAGGYHHHMAMNTWHLPGRGPARPGAGAGPRRHRRPDPRRRG
jgi:catechol 2,3-dioxygenase